VLRGSNHLAGLVISSLWFDCPAVGPPIVGLGRAINSIEALIAPESPSPSPVSSRMTPERITRVLVTDREWRPSPGGDALKANHRRDDSGSDQDLVELQHPASLGR
jgi:hypothetical protein